MSNQRTSAGTAAQQSSKSSLLLRQPCILAMLLLCAVYSGCSYGTNYKYKWKVAITYTNGEKDTINYDYTTFKGNEAYTYLKISESGLLSSGRTEPCIIVGCGFRRETITCGVRNYEILTLEKLPVK